MIEIERLTVDLYIRVSTDKQANEGDSLEEQEVELKKYCEYRGFEIRNVLIERGRSGGNTNRPEYQKLIKDVKAKRINAVVVKKLDRLSRSLLDFENLMTLLLENQVEFMSLRESFDTSTAMGKATLRIALVFAQLEREQTSERITDVMAYRASQGMYNGGITSYGYTSVNKELVPYPKEKQLVEVIFEQFTKNKSITETAKFLNKAGYRNRQSKLWDKRRINDILQNPIYIGKLQWKKEIFQGIHQPVISEKRFYEVQEIFKNQRRIQGKSRTKAALQGLLFCGCCKTLMTPSHSLNRKKVKYYYYRCTSTLNSEKGKRQCALRYVSFSVVEGFLLKILLSLSEEGPFKEIENQILRHNLQIEKAVNLIEKENHNLERKLELATTKKDKYFDSLIATKFSSSERQKINKRLDEIELEEKQIQGLLYKQQFEISKTKDELVNITSIKQQFITFRMDKDEFSFEELKDYLSTIIKEIYYYANKLTVVFKYLPEPVDFNQDHAVADPDP